MASDYTLILKLVLELFQGAKSLLTLNNGVSSKLKTSLRFFFFFCIAWLEREYLSIYIHSALEVFLSPYHLTLFQWHFSSPSRDAVVLLCLWSFPSMDLPLMVIRDATKMCFNEGSLKPLSLQYIVLFMKFVHIYICYNLAGQFNYLCKRSHAVVDMSNGAKWS